MKRTIMAGVLLLCMASLVMAAGTAQPTVGGLVLADFESFNGVLDASTDQKSINVDQVSWWCYNDKDAGKSSSIKLEPVGDAAQGEKALKITYRLDGWTGGGNSPIGQDPAVVAAAWDWSKYTNFSFYVKGNGQKQTYLIEFADKDGEVFRSPEQKVEKAEWTKVMIPLKSFKSRVDWQPKVKVNKVLDWPCASWQIIPLSNKGEITFDLFEVTP